MTTISDTSQETDDLLLERQLCFALTVASRSVVGVYKPVLEKLGLTHPQYLVMLALWERSPRTLKDISDSLLHDPATLSPLLKRLEEAQLITRERVPGNERALAITLTDKGSALRAQATAVPGEIRNRLHLSREEVAELHQAMTGLIAATQRTADEPRKMEAT
ncbi:MarR family transcriptional regulator [Arthrobacter sp. StoSoilB3]|uniref:MarR family winged helix-turn-helix transcriptional regulator n=1 Tax=Paenarthrobacter nicotinovorans TaxID=29320 RepID=UPI001E7B59AA|nr:MarR family transcriptional regulator [Arthrobacter sp. StoSoilB3]